MALHRTCSIWRFNSVIVVDIVRILPPFGGWLGPRERADCALGGSWHLAPLVLNTKTWAALPFAEHYARVREVYIAIANTGENQMREPDPLPSSRRTPSTRFGFHGKTSKAIDTWIFAPTPNSQASRRRWRRKGGSPCARTWWTSCARLWSGRSPTTPRPI